ncbi:MAG TPA: hypothetical protein VKJ45_16755 [Blastocatellia bacterium]|nr:hypothetical protein [Blastocatellia bacterium]
MPLQQHLPGITGLLFAFVLPAFGCCRSNYMCDAMEPHFYLYSRDDSELEWGELQSKFLDSESESGDEQWRAWERATVDIDRVLQRFWGVRRGLWIGFGVRCTVEFDGGLHGWNDREFQRYQLHGELLDSESESIHE